MESKIEPENVVQQQREPQLETEPEEPDTEQGHVCQDSPVFE